MPNVERYSLFQLYILILDFALLQMYSSFPGFRLASTGRQGSQLSAKIWLMAVVLCLLSLDESGAKPISTGQQYLQAARPARCADDDLLFRHCFLCGRLADDGRIYRGCCDGDETVTLFCDHMML